MCFSVELLSMKKHRSYKEAEQFVRSLKLNNAKEWRVYAKVGGKPLDIPSAPNVVYKDKGWKNWRIWIGTEYLDFYEARQFARGLELNSAREWKSYVGKNRPKNMPYDPQQFYKNKGWIGWKDWLGYNRNFDQNHRRHYADIDFFKTWSHDMAYVLGLWWADGYISYGYSFGITLHKKDKELLYRVSKCLNAEDCLHFNNNVAIISINSKEMYNDLLCLGGQPRKSLALQMPDIPSEYVADFVRGYFDGDGSIYYSTNDKAYYASITCGNKDFLKQLESLLGHHIGGFKCYIQSRYRDVVIKGIEYKNLFSSELGMNANITKAFGEFIYSTTCELKMERKYRLFHNIGHVRVANKDKEFLSFKNARRQVRGLGLKSSADWFSFKERPLNIPSHPEKYYEEEWVSWSDWMGYNV